MRLFTFCVFEEMLIYTIFNQALDFKRGMIRLFIDLKFLVISCLPTHHLPHTVEEVKK